jgi:ubiquinol-cytochrome c reductase cytochrome c1 subunit
MFPGHQIAMPPPLSDGQVSYEDGTTNSVEQMARDVTAFLSWSAEPELEDRKRLGIKAILFLLVLTGLLFALKRRVWSDVH